MLDTAQSEEVRRAQGNYLGAHAETIPSSPVSKPASKPRPTSAERSAAISAALLAKKSRVRIGETPQLDRRASVKPTATSGESQTAAEENKSASEIPVTGSIDTPVFTSSLPLAAAIIQTNDVGAAVTPYSAVANPATVSPAAASPAITNTAVATPAVSAKIVPVNPLESLAVTTPVAAAISNSAITSTASSGSNKGLWLAVSAIALLIAGYVFWPSPEPLPPQAPQPKPVEPVVKVEIAPQGTVFRDVLKDGTDGPEMVVIPAGSFNMGSPENEADRGLDEGPQHRVTITEFAIGKTEVSVAQFQQFVTATDYVTDAEKNSGNSQGCAAFKAGTVFGNTSQNHWKHPGFEQKENHPAVCLSWNDAQAYVSWLGLQTGKRYRLPSEAEQEYAIRAGTATPYAWGGEVNFACNYANVMDQASLAKFEGFPAVQCSDKFVLTSPVASFEANAFGVHDLVGNVVEWTADCSNANYEGAPTDGSAWTSGDCSRRVLSGAGWLDTPTHLRSAYRGRGAQSFRNIDTGVRLALGL